MDEGQRNVTGSRPSQPAQRSQVIDLQMTVDAMGNATFRVKDRGIQAEGSTWRHYYDDSLDGIVATLCGRPLDLNVVAVSVIFGTMLGGSGGPPQISDCPKCRDILPSLLRTPVEDPGLVTVEVVGPEGDEIKLQDDHAQCPTCKGVGQVALVTSWDCTVCGREVDPRSAWIPAGPHRVRHAKGAPSCRRGLVIDPED